MTARPGADVAKWALAVCCVYEAASIAAGKTPTFTELSRKYPLLAPVILVILAAHLYRQPHVRAEIECRLCLDPFGDES